MDTKLERLDGNLVRLTVTVSAEEVDRAIDATYKRVASKLRIPGFRPGKAPRPIIDGHVGREAVLAEAQEAIVSDTYTMAVDTEDLRTVGDPDLGELDLPAEGEQYEYSAEVEVRPQLTLTDAEPFTVEVPSAKATEREIDAQVSNMRERFATLVPVEDRGAGPEDFVLVSFTGLVDGEEYEGNKVDKYLYEMGRGLMPKEFDDAVVGAKPGDVVTAEFKIPDTSSNPDFVGKTAHFTITVHEIKAKVLPDLDDEFAGNVGGFDTMEELRADLRKRIEEAKSVGHVQGVEREARRILGERVEGDIPEAMVASTREAMTRDFFNGLETRGITLQDYANATGVQPERIESDIAEQAERSVREELALEALFRTKGMEVTDQDLDEALREIGGDRPVEEVREQWRRAGVLPVVREQVMHRKATRWLMDNVTVVEKEPQPVGDNDSPAGSEGGSEKTSSGKKTSRKKKGAAEEAPAAKPADEEPATQELPAEDEQGSEE